MKDAVIISGVRTAIGSFGGSYKETSAAKLGNLVIKEAVSRASINKEEIDEVYMGCVLQAGLGQNIARQAAIQAGLPIKTPSSTINMVCGSGLKSVILAAQSINSGKNEAVVAGGVENMSLSPYILKDIRWGKRIGDTQVEDYMVNDGLTDIFSGNHMGITAENIARKYNISRLEQDAFAARSQEKAEVAIKNGVFKEEILPVLLTQKNGDTVLFQTDEFVKFETTQEKLSKLKPAFQKDGTVTAGNSSGINDGAAAVIVMTQDAAKQRGIKSIAKIVAHSCVGVEPDYMGMGPVPAVRNVLKDAGLTLNEIGLFELNEAFAAQSLAVINELELNPELINVNGGAIALGHPIGASGTRILVTLIYEMRRRNIKYGLCALCIGGGMGISMILENADV